MQQATSAHSSTTPGTSPGNDTEISGSGTTRRALFGFAAGAVAAASASGAALAFSAPTGQADAFDAALARWTKASSACADYHRTTVQPAYKRYLAAIDAVPHTAVAYERAGETCWMTTANPNDLIIAKAVVRESARHYTAMPGFMDACGQLCLASAARSAQNDRLYDTHGLHAVDDRADALEAERYDAMWAVFKAPATTARQLAAKIVAIAAEESLGEGCAQDALLADARRLAA